MATALVFAETPAFADPTGWVPPLSVGLGEDAFAGPLVPRGVFPNTAMGATASYGDGFVELVTVAELVVPDVLVEFPDAGATSLVLAWPLVVTVARPGAEREDRLAAVLVSVEPQYDLGRDDLRGAGSTRLLLGTGNRDVKFVGIVEGGAMAFNWDRWGWLAGLGIGYAGSAMMLNLAYRFIGAEVNRHDLTLELMVPWGHL